MSTIQHELKLWHYNKNAATWVPIKTCREETALVWLAAFSLEQPQEHFRLAKKRP